MEPFTTAIVAAATLGTAAGVKDVSKKAVIDLYDGLKSIIKKRFGHEHKVVKAIEDVEANPASDGRKMILHEEVTSSKIGDDPEIVQALNALLEQIKAQPGGSQIIGSVTQTATGGHNAQAVGGGDAIVNHTS